MSLKLMRSYIPEDENQTRTADHSSGLDQGHKDDIVNQFLTTTVEG